MTGDGVKEFFDAVEASRGEYERCVFNICLYSNRPPCANAHTENISQS